MKGFRQESTPSRKERVRELEAEVKNTQMALRISQMMLQQLMQSNKSMSEDLSRSLSLISELQYKTLAIQKAANLDLGALGKIADELRLKDFEETSAKEDAEKNYSLADVVSDESIVILTSKTEGEDQGFFRSKLKLSESGSPELIQGLMGQAVGTKVKVKLNGVEHEVELLGIRQPPQEQKIELVQADAQVEQVNA